MLDAQLERRGISDRRVLEAMGAVPREAFVPPERAHEAYADHAVTLAAGQTISQPWIVAAICQALELAADDRVLEICLLYTSPSPRDGLLSRMPSSA